MSKSGTIGVDFDSIILTDGRAFAVQAELSSVNSRDQKQQVDEEGHVKGGDAGDRSVVFIGGGAGLGAVIGAISGGGKGAAAGAGTGAAIGTATVLLMKGDDARVAPGMEFGMRLVRALNIETNDNPTTPTITYTTRNMIRRAQEALTEKGFYDGPTDGVSGPRTRAAIRDFQRSRNLPETGQLDERTAQELGIVGIDRVARNERNNRHDDDNAAKPVKTATPVAVRVVRATAERNAEGGIRVTVLTEVNSGGWRVFADNGVTDDVLDIYARGLQPEGMAAQVMQQLTIDTTITGDLSRVRKVVVHGADPEAITINVDNGNIDKVNWTRKLADLEQRALDVLGNYRADLGMTSRTVSDFDTSRSYTDEQIQLLFSMESFANSAKLFARLDNRVSDRESRRASMHAGAESLLREFVIADKLIGSARPSDGVYNTWSQIRQDMTAIADQFHIDIVAMKGRFD
jgi:peptidoglycan hydrolase-like protein with peptidoglycan-binding domain